VALALVKLTGRLRHDQAISVLQAACRKLVTTIAAGFPADVKDKGYARTFHELAALEPDRDPRAVAAKLASLVRVTGAQNSDMMAALMAAYGLVARQLPSATARQAVLRELLDAIVQDNDAKVVRFRVDLYALAAEAADKAERADNAQDLLDALVRSTRGDGREALARLLQTELKQLDRRSLVELVKAPTCVGVGRQAVLLRLGEETGQSFKDTRGSSVPDQRLSSAAAAGLFPASRPCNARYCGGQAC
jgi:hypothetical protein